MESPWFYTAGTATRKRREAKVTVQSVTPWDGHQNRTPFFDTLHCITQKLRDPELL